MNTSKNIPQSLNPSQYQSQTKNNLSTQPKITTITQCKISKISWRYNFNDGI